MLVINVNLNPLSITQQAKFRENSVIASKSTEKDKKRKDLPLEIEKIYSIVFIHKYLRQKKLCYT